MTDVHRSHDADRLEEIREEMRSLLTEARHLVRRHSTMAELDRAERTWLANIELALDHETQWLARPDRTLESEIERLRET